MASLQTPLLAVLILLSVMLQATDAGEAGDHGGFLLPPLLERALGPNPPLALAALGSDSAF